MTRMKEAVVEGGVEGERSKNVRRISKSLAPKAHVETLGAIEAKLSILLLLRLHVVIVSGIGLLVFILERCPKLGFGLTVRCIRLSLSLMHELTILVTIQLCHIVSKKVKHNRRVSILRTCLVLMPRRTWKYLCWIHQCVLVAACSQRIPRSATGTYVTCLGRVDPTLDELRREHYLKHTC